MVLGEMVLTANAMAYKGSDSDADRAGGDPPGTWKRPGGGAELKDERRLKSEWGSDGEGLCLPLDSLPTAQTPYRDRSWCRPVCFLCIHRATHLHTLALFTVQPFLLPYSDFTKPC